MMEISTFLFVFSLIILLFSFIHSSIVMSKLDDKNLCISDLLQQIRKLENEKKKLIEISEQEEVEQNER